MTWSFTFFGKFIRLRLDHQLSTTLRLETPFTSNTDA